MSLFRRGVLRVVIVLLLLPLLIIGSHTHGFLRLVLFIVTAMAMLAGFLFERSRRGD